MARKRTKDVDYAAQVAALVTVAESLDHGPAKIAVLEEAVRIADARRDDDLGFEVRQELIEAATFGGAPDVSMVAFAWCLARYDKDPDRFDTFDLLWKYKWVIDQAPGYPQVSRRQIADMLADMARRYRAVGSGPHPVHQMTRNAAVDMGDLPAARKAHARVQKSSATWLSNCPACEIDAQVDFYLSTGRPAIAWRKGEPVFAGRLTCGEVPHRTYGRVLLPLLFAGEGERAAEYHRKGVRLIRVNPKFLYSAARHLVFLTVTDNLPAAAKYLEKYLVYGLTTTCPDWRFAFDRSAAFLFDRLADQPKPPRVRFPPGAPLPAGVNTMNPTVMRDHFLGEARELAAAFDARNGNDSFARKLAELADLKDRVTPFKV